MKRLNLFKIIKNYFTSNGISYKKKKTLRDEVLSEGNVDFQNILKSSFEAKELYNSLKGKCHPDKFKDEKENAEATAIFQLLQQYKYDYKKLCEIKKRAEVNLNINFK